MSDKKEKKRRLPLAWFIIFASLFAVLFVVVMLLTQNLFIYNTVASVLGDKQRALVAGDYDKYVRYEGDYDSKEDVLAAANELNERICEEGTVLLKNENGALPLSEDERRVTVFGKNSTDIIIGGTGSNAGSTGSEAVDLSVALDASDLPRTPLCANT